MDKEKIEKIIKSDKIVLFMKGDKYMPRCGFSARVVEILDNLGHSYTSYDILEDAQLREQLKEYSAWPTYPQLYVKAEFIGGCDIVIEMEQSGQLKDLLNSI